MTLRAIFGLIAPPPSFTAWMGLRSSRNISSLVNWLTCVPSCLMSYERNRRNTAAAENSCKKFLGLWSKKVNGESLRTTDELHDKVRLARGKKAKSISRKWICPGGRFADEVANTGSRPSLGWNCVDPSSYIIWISPT